MISLVLAFDFDLDVALAAGNCNTDLTSMFSGATPMPLTQSDHSIELLGKITIETKNHNDFKLHVNLKTNNTFIY